VLQCVAVCCSVLQCVAVCCSVSQCVAVSCRADNSPAPFEFMHVFTDTIPSRAHWHCRAVHLSVLKCIGVCCTFLF